MSDDKENASAASVRPGHGDHWLAALPQDDARLAQALETPIDAPDRLTLHREPLTKAIDRVQVTHRRRLVTAYPEPRATMLVQGRPRELVLWETRVEGWLTLEHEGAGALTVFVTDLAERANRYAAHSGGTMGLELGALAYFVNPLRTRDGTDRLMPARTADPRFLADDYAFEATVLQVQDAGEEVVLDLALQNGLTLPLTARHVHGVEAGDRVSGYLWLTGRWPA